MDCEPGDRCEQHRHDGKEPHSLPVEVLLADDAILLRLKEEPVEEEEHEEHATTDEENGSSSGNDFSDRRIVAERRHECPDWPEFRRAEPEDEPGQQAANNEDCEEQSPEQEPPSGPLRHLREHF